MNSKIHPFEAEGLGKAPFYFVGTYEHHDTGESNGATDYGTNCDYCQAYIRNVFIVKSSDGKTFKVGSECIKKTNSEGELLREVKIAIAEQKKAKLEQKWQEFLQNESKYAEELNKVMHPWISSLTMYDYALWIKNHSGASDTAKRKVLSAVRKIEKGLK